MDLALAYVRISGSFTLSKKINESCRRMNQAGRQKSC